MCGRAENLTVQTVREKTGQSVTFFSSPLFDGHQLLAADDHDLIEIPAAALRRHISNPADTDG